MKSVICLQNSRVLGKGEKITCVGIECAWC